MKLAWALWPENYWTVVGFSYRFLDALFNWGGSFKVTERGRTILEVFE